MAKKKPKKYRCDNCSKEWTRTELRGIEFAPGTTFESGELKPAGRCPDCGWMCFPVEVYEQGRARRGGDR